MQLFTLIATMMTTLGATPFNNIGFSPNSQVQAKDKDLTDDEYNGFLNLYFPPVTPLPVPPPFGNLSDDEYEGFLHFYDQPSTVPTVSPPPVTNPLFNGPGWVVD